MNLVEIAQTIGIYPKKVASTRGGEYHSPCPNCGGKDRFIIQPNYQQKNCTGVFHCRQCEIHGDTIQFCRDFMNMDFRSACQKLGVEKERSSSHYSRKSHANHPRQCASFSLPASNEYAQKF